MTVEDSSRRASLKRRRQVGTPPGEPRGVPVGSTRRLRRRLHGADGEEECLAVGVIASVVVGDHVAGPGGLDRETLALFDHFAPPRLAVGHEVAPLPLGYPP